MVPALMLSIIAMSLIFTGNLNGRGAFDQINYHERAIRTFATQLPSPDTSDYLSATTPGYHIVLAVVARTVADNQTFLRLAGLAFSIVLVLLCARWAAHRIDARVAVLFSLPLALSLYVVYSAGWLLPDNAGWLGVLCILILSLSNMKLATRLAFSSVALVLLVCFRQIHIWVAACLWASAWCSSTLDSNTPIRFPTWLPPLDQFVTRSKHLGLAMLASAPAFCVLLWFKHVWHGHLTPPSFVDYHNSGLNPSALAFMLAVLACISAPFSPMLAGRAHALFRGHRARMMALLVATVIVAVSAPTSYSEDAGRFSGLWNIAHKLPAPAARSILIVPLAVVGGITLIAWSSYLESRARWVLISAFLAYAAAMTASFQVWQRYVEPCVLLLVFLMCVEIVRRNTNNQAIRSQLVVGTTVLASAMAGITALKLVASKPAKYHEHVVPAPPTAQEPSPTP